MRTTKPCAFFSCCCTAGNARLHASGTARSLRNTVAASVRALLDRNRAGHHVRHRGRSRNGRFSLKRGDLLQHHRWQSRVTRPPDRSWAQCSLYTYRRSSTRGHRVAPGHSVVETAVSPARWCSPRSRPTEVRRSVPLRSAPSVSGRAAIAPDPRPRPPCRASVARPLITKSPCRAPLTLWDTSSAP
jgi:hypothetical protein